LDVKSQIIIWKNQRMTQYEVLKVILDEKRTKDSKIKTTNDLSQWFWKVGFRKIKIDEEKRTITCYVLRPNPFISNYRRPYINFLIYLSDKVFPNLGYTFNLEKYNDDKLASLYSRYLNQEDKER